MAKIMFNGAERQRFYLKYLKKCSNKDVHHMALVYCLGIDKDTRVNVNRIYNFETSELITKCLMEGWQTGGSMKIT